MKKCHSCGLTLPLFMFTTAKRFTIPTDKGKNRVCRICNFKKSKYPVVRWLDNKFKVVQLTFKERIKEFFKR